MEDPDAQLDALLSAVGVSIAPASTALELGCGSGRRTVALARRAAHVIAFEPSADALELARERSSHWSNVSYVEGDGETLAGLDDASVDAAIAPDLLRRLPGAKAQLGHVQELGRVLRPGGFAVFALSTDPEAEARAEAEAAPPPVVERAHPDGPRASRREMFRLLAPRVTAPRPRAPRPAAPGAHVPLDALGSVAVQAGLELERIEGSGTRDTIVLARRPVPR